MRKSYRNYLRRMHTNRGPVSALEVSDVTTIAGHTFDASSGFCTCGRRFSDISGANEDDIDSLHWAHVGGLTRSELDQIVSERERLWKALMG